MNDDGYGLWFLVLFNSALFILFAVSATQTPRFLPHLHATPKPPLALRGRR